LGSKRPGQTITMGALYARTSLKPKWRRVAEQVRKLALSEKEEYEELP